MEKDLVEEGYDAKFCRNQCKECEGLGEDSPFHALVHSTLELALVQLLYRRVSEEVGTPSHTETQEDMCNTCEDL